MASPIYYGPASAPYPYVWDPQLGWIIPYFNPATAGTGSTGITVGGVPMVMNGGFAVTMPAAASPGMLGSVPKEDPTSKPTEEKMNARQCLVVLNHINRNGISDMQEALNWMETPHPDLSMREPVDCEFADVIRHIDARRRSKVA